MDVKMNIAMVDTVHVRILDIEVRIPVWLWLWKSHCEFLLGDTVFDELGGYVSQIYRKYYEDIYG